MLRGNKIVLTAVRVIAAVLSAVLFAVSALSQQVAPGAALSGVVSDNSGSAIAGATIDAHNLETGIDQTTTTDGNGRFRFAYLPVGEYELKASADKFAAETRRFTATVGQAVELSISLNIESLTATVDVNEQSNLVDANRTSIAETVLPKQISGLPLNGRNFLDLTLLTPGVSRTNTGNVQRFAETSAVPGTGISFAGQRNLASSFIVDGSSANDDSVELAGTYYSQEVIREFQVITNGATAEFGRASGGFVNIVTDSGTNEFSGKIYGFLRNQRLDARNPLATSRDPLTQVQYGGSIGGPIIKNRTFFFTNFEQTRRNDSNVITIAPANVATINARLDAIHYPGPRVVTGLVPGGYDTTNLFARIDHKINSKNFFSATYNFYDIDARNARTVGGLNTVSRGTDLENRDHTFNTQNITTISPKAINEFRFQFRRSRLGAPPADPIGPAVNISGVASFGTATSSPTRRDIDLYQLTDAVGFSTGKHSLKSGVEFLYNNLNIEFPGAIQGVYSFSNLNTFLSGTYSQFQQAFGAISQKQSNPNFGVFAQDEWKPLRRLTINFGLRYDLQFLPDPIKTDTNNVAPRVGFAFSPNDKTVIRGNIGIFYDRIPTRATSNALQRDGVKYVVAIFAPNTPGAPVFPNVLVSRPSVLVVKPSITAIDPNIENNSSYQANVQIERQLPFDSSVSVGYLWVRGLHIILSRNLNVPRCLSNVDPNLCRPDPNFGNIGRFEGSGDSYYNGLVVSFNKRQGKWASYRASYTFSKSIDDSGNFFFSTPQDNFNLRGDRGLSDNDQRHRLVLSGTFEIPRRSMDNALTKIFEGFRGSWIYTYASSLPYNVQAGVDLNRDTNLNDRPNGLGQNTGRGFDYSSLDLRISRLVRFSEKTSAEFLIEGFNVLNRANYSVPNNTITSPAFGKPTVAFDPRQIQLGFRLSF
jgi:hypothetical protein